MKLWRIILAWFTGKSPDEPLKKFDKWEPHVEWRVPYRPDPPEDKKE